MSSPYPTQRVIQIISLQQSRGTLRPGSHFLNRLLKPVKLRASQSFQGTKENGITYQEGHYSDNSHICYF